MGGICTFQPTTVMHIHPTLHVILGPVPSISPDCGYSRAEKMESAGDSFLVWDTRPSMTLWWVTTRKEYKILEFLFVTPAVARMIRILYPPPSLSPLTLPLILLKPAPLPRLPARASRHWPCSTPIWRSAHHASCSALTQGLTAFPMHGAVRC